MRAITLYLHLHQPYRYRKYSVFEVGNDKNYWCDANYYSGQNNRRIFEKVAEKSYVPMLDLLERKMREHKDFKVSFSITGTWLEQATEWRPELIEQIRRMVKTGQVEIVGETYYHSLAFFYDKTEFEAQVLLHRAKIKELFDVKTKAFRNTELAYRDDLGLAMEKFGFETVLAEGWDKVLGWKSAGHVYHVRGTEKVNLLLKNYRLSDDIAFRFSDRNWTEWPLTVNKYQNWVNMEMLRGPLVNLFMDFETFGEHQWADTGVFEFWDKFVDSWLAEYENKFLTVSEAAKVEPARDEISMPEVVTWADTQRDLSAWAGNSLQDSAMKKLYDLRERVLATNDEQLIADFRRLTTSDHAYYMSTKYWNDGDVHAYFSAYESPYEAFMYFMNVVRDLEFRIEKIEQSIIK